jgi:hypothetical protein
VVDYILYKAPIRDLILGAATVLLLVILGAQSRLLVSAPKGAPTTTDATLAGAGATLDVPKTTSPTSVAPTPPLQAPTIIAKAPRPNIRGNVGLRPKPAIEPPATLDLAVQHQFKDATLFVYIDGKVALTRPLHGAVQKKLIVFNGVRGVESESVEIPAGRHVLRVRALSTDQTTDLSKTVTADFVGGDSKSLQVTFEKHNSVMKLTWQ